MRGPRTVSTFSSERGTRSITGSPGSSSCTRLFHTAAPSRPRMLRAARLMNDDAPILLAREEPGGSAVEDLLMERGQPPQVRLAGREPSARRQELPAEVARQRRDQEVRQDVAGEGEAEAHHQRRGRLGTEPQQVRGHDGAVRPRAGRGRHERPPLRQEDGGGDDRQRVREGERRVRPARHGHQARGDEDVSRHLDNGGGPAHPAPAQPQPVDEREDVDEPDAQEGQGVLGATARSSATRRAAATRRPSAADWWRRSGRRTATSTGCAARARPAAGRAPRLDWVSPASALLT